MKICPTCRHTADDAITFCPACGSTMQAVVEESAQPVQTPPESVAPAYAEPAYAEPQPAYMQQPQYNYAQPPYAQQAQVQPSASPVSKGRVIAGMALGIAGMSMAISGVLFAFLTFIMACVATDTYVPDEVLLVYVVYTFVFLAFGLPLSIVGRTMSHSNRANGDQTKMSHLGGKFGNIGLILSIVTGALGIIATIIIASVL